MADETTSTPSGRQKSPMGVSSRSPVSNESVHATSQEVQSTDTPHHFDVLLGRGRGISLHSGNLRFNQIIRMITPRYEQARLRHEKTMITEEVVQIIMRTGRFLRKDKITGKWVKADNEAARHKVGHALRYKVRTSVPSTPSTNLEDSPSGVAALNSLPPEDTFIRDLFLEDFPSGIAATNSSSSGDTFMRAPFQNHRDIFPPTPSQGEVVELFTDEEIWSVLGSHQTLTLDWEQTFARDGSSENEDIS